jgi:hypothetical protein
MNVMSSIGLGGNVTDALGMSRLLKRARHVDSFHEQFQLNTSLYRNHAT